MKKKHSKKFGPHNALSIILGQIKLLAFYKGLGPNPYTEVSLKVLYKSVSMRD